MDFTMGVPTCMVRSRMVSESDGAATPKNLTQLR